jgi:hypothetical protein
MGCAIRNMTRSGTGVGPGVNRRYFIAKSFPADPHLFCTTPYPFFKALFRPDPRMMISGPENCTKFNNAEREIK